MIVMKFGGAAVKDAASIKNTAEIIRSYIGQKVVVVVSAMDKTTSALETLADFATSGKEKEAFEQLAFIENFHKTAIYELFPGDSSVVVLRAVEGYFIELERIVRGLLMLKEFSDRIYDRIMAHGELLSSVILHHHLMQKQTPIAWIDARTVITTDSKFKSAGVIWSITVEQIQRTINALHEQVEIILTQGYIASNTEGYTTTLGREGSDFTASIFAYALNAEQVITWKDVPGIMSADPKLNPDAIKLDTLSYQQAVEMTFYGANVIHPKTIKPLQNKNIPLNVKSFKHTDLEGTLIGPSSLSTNETCSIIKKNQVVLHITPKDFSFMDLQLIQKVFTKAIISDIRINLIQTSAISITLCADHTQLPVSQFVSSLTDEFIIEVTDKLYLLTVLNVPAGWHFDGEPMLVQRERANAYLVYANTPIN